MKLIGAIFLTSIGIFVLRSLVFIIVHSNYSINNVEPVLGLHTSCMVPVSPNCRKLTQLKPIDNTDLEDFRKNQY